MATVWAAKALESWPMAMGQVSPEATAVDVLRGGGGRMQRCAVISLIHTMNHTYTRAQQDISGTQVRTTPLPTPKADAGALWPRAGDLDSHIDRIGAQHYVGRDVPVKRFEPYDSCV